MITLGTRLGLLLAEPSHMASTELHLFRPLRTILGYCMFTTAWPRVSTLFHLPIPKSLPNDADPPLTGFSLAIPLWGFSSTLRQNCSQSQIEVSHVRKFMMMEHHFDLESAAKRLCCNCESGECKRCQPKTFYTYLVFSHREPKEREEKNLLHYCTEQVKLVFGIQP
jgi:hypothetical protein